MDDLATFVNAAQSAPQALQDLEMEVRNAKTFAYLSLGLLAYIAFKVK